MLVQGAPPLWAENEQIRVAEVTLTRQLDWISRADGKASFVIGIQTAMLGVLAATATPLNTWNLALSTLTGTVVALLLTGLFFVYSATFPRLSGPAESLIFFGPIASLESREFARRFAETTGPKYLTDLLQQIHQNAAIANRKYCDVKAAYQMLLIAAVPWGMALYSFRTVHH